MDELPLLLEPWRVHDGDVTLAWMNRAARAFLGQRPDADLDGQSIADILPPGAVDFARRVIASAVDAPVQVDRIATRHDGRVRLIKWSLQRAAGGAPNEVAAIGFDMTDLFRAGVEQVGPQSAEPGRAGDGPVRCLSGRPACPRLRLGGGRRRRTGTHLREPRVRELLGPWCFVARTAHDGDRGEHQRERHSEDPARCRLRRRP